MADNSIGAAAIAYQETASGQAVVSDGDGNFSCSLYLLHHSALIPYTKLLLQVALLYDSSAVRSTYALFFCYKHNL